MARNCHAFFFSYPQLIYEYSLVQIAQIHRGEKIKYNKILTYKLPYVKLNVNKDM